MFIEKYFASLGRFLYAIAVSDGEVQKKEERTLDHCIHEKGEEFRNAGDQETYNYLLVTKLAFYNGLETRLPCSVAARQLEEVLDKYGSRLADAHKKTGMELINKMIHSYGGVGQVEERLLNSVLEKLQPSE